jgi:flagellar hook-associated protein 3 FlgL
MRVTDRMIFDNANRWTTDASSRLEQATEVASTGVRVGRAADDPGAAGLLGTRQQTQARADAIAQETGRAADELGLVDGALQTVSTTLGRARQLAVQFANATYNADQRASGATEVDGLINQVLSALNTKVGNRYVFAGSKDDTQPFDAAGAYSGDGLVRQVEVAPGVLQDSSVRADVAIKGAGGGVDVLATLQALSAALASNDVAGVQGTLDALDRSTAQVSSARASAGTAMNALDAGTAVAKAASTAEKTAVSHLQDADMADAGTQLALAQRALESAVQASSQSFLLSLSLLSTIK